MFMSYFTRAQCGDVNVGELNDCCWGSLSGVSNRSGGSPGRPAGRAPSARPAAPPGPVVRRAELQQIYLMCTVPSQL